MREIKFRGFSKTLNKWIIGVPYFSEGNWWILVDENTKSDDIGTGSYFVDKNSIGQHTGLKDKNGVKIYEDDIVTIMDCEPSLYKICYWDNNFKWGVEYIGNDKTNWQYENLEEFSYEDFEVIGNIYENPELLEGAI
ncbi:YopX family protein [Aliarcobacter cryaerophilus]|uniref:YopX family protein n=1 Tax=Aliarcobacter cryaerophilus TaxID=28198 RepID=UPI003DA56DE4